MYQTFNMTGNLENFWELNMASVTATLASGSPYGCSRQHFVFMCPPRSPHRPNVTRIVRTSPASRRGGGDGARLRLWFGRTRGVPRPQHRIGCPASAGRRRRHRGEPIEGEEGDMQHLICFSNIQTQHLQYTSEDR
jgi:hypothetical protein